jgi:hypothetical protein
MADRTLRLIGMFLVAGVGGLAWFWIMPDFLSAAVVCLIWGLAVGNFWARNLAS